MTATSNQHRLPHAGAARAGAERLARLSAPRDAPLRGAGRADRRRAARHDVESHHLRAGHRRRAPTTTTRCRAGRLRAAPTPRSSNRSRSRTCAARPTCSARSTTRPSGADGFVSLEVSPALARDTEGTIAEAGRLWPAVDRPNVMIKIPGTEGGLAGDRTAASPKASTSTSRCSFRWSTTARWPRPICGPWKPARAQGRADRPAGLGGLVLREPGGHRGGRPARRDRPAGGGGARRRHHRRSPTPASPMRGSRRSSGATAGSGWRRRARRRSGRSGPAPAPRTRPTPTCSTSTQLIGRDTINTVPPETLRKFEDHGTVAPTLAGP